MNRDTQELPAIIAELEEGYKVIEAAQQVSISRLSFSAALI